MDRDADQGAALCRAVGGHARSASGTCPRDGVFCKVSAMAQRPGTPRRIGSPPQANGRSIPGSSTGRATICRRASTPWLQVAGANGDAGRRPPAAARGWTGTTATRPAGPGQGQAVSNMASSWRRMVVRSGQDPLLALRGAATGRHRWRQAAPAMSGAHHQPAAIGGKGWFLAMSAGRRRGGSRPTTRSSPGAASGSAARAGPR